MNSIGSASSAMRRRCSSHPLVAQSESGRLVIVGAHYFSSFSGAGVLRRFALRELENAHQHAVIINLSDASTSALGSSSICNELSECPLGVLPPYGVLPP